MWKFIILALALYVLYKLFANDFVKKKKENEKRSREDEEKKIACGEMVKDPECGAYVAVDDSISVRDGKQVYYFCSYDCRDKFLERLESGQASLPKKDGGD